MGANQSAQNVISNMVSESTNTWSSASETAAIVTGCVNKIISGATCGSLVVQDTTQTCEIASDINTYVKNVQSTTVTSKVCNDIQQAIKQKVQSMSFNFTSEEANQVMNSVTNICTNIYQSVTNGDFASSTLVNDITCQAGDMKVLNVNQIAIGDLVIQAYMDNNQTAVASSEATTILSQKISQTQENSLWALALVILALAALVMSPLIGTGYFMAKSSKNKIMMLTLAILFLLTSNIYLHSECIKHSFPVARFPPLLPKSMSIPLFPAWCHTKKQTVTSFVITWLIFGIMIYVVMKATPGEGGSATAAITK